MQNSCPSKIRPSKVVPQGKAARRGTSEPIGRNAMVARLFHDKKVNGRERNTARRWQSSELAAKRNPA
jgi:hypothetical protein